jgi:hypothetical protein
MFSNGKKPLGRGPLIKNFRFEARAGVHESGGAAASSYRLSSMKARPASHQLTPLPLTYDSNEKT